MIVVVIQARTGSTRLPGKVLADIDGQPMLVRQISRIARADLPEHILVATSDLPQDNVIADVMNQSGIDVYRGSSDDVLDRIRSAAQAVGATHIVRLTADCPLSDPEIIDQVISQHLTQRNDISSNVVERSFPDGLDVEVCTMAALSRAHNEAVKSSDREHVTPYMYRSENGFRIGSVRLEENLSNLRWTVDFPEDLTLIRRIFAAFPQRQDQFTMREVRELFAHNPELAAMNAVHIA